MHISASVPQVPTMLVEKNINMSIVGSYELGATLGKGSFGEVRVATHIETAEQFAIKIVSTMTMNQEMLDKEIKHHQRLSHKHVVRIHEVIEQEELTYIVMELVSGGDLLGFILEQVRVREREARRIFQQLISGLEHCHDEGVAHRDLKAENIFMDASGNVKIGDFGLSGEIRTGELLRESCGSFNYAAPELLGRDCAYEGPEVDVWACGVILYALLTQALPFDSPYPWELKRLIKKGRFSVPGFVSEDAKDLIGRILTVDRGQRMSIADIREHRWFKADLPADLFRSSSVADNRSDVTSDISNSEACQDEQKGNPSSTLLHLSTEDVNNFDNQVSALSDFPSCETSRKPQKADLASDISRSTVAPCHDSDGQVLCSLMTLPKVSSSSSKFSSGPEEPSPRSSLESVSERAQLLSDRAWGSNSSLKDRTASVVCACEVSDGCGVPREIEQTQTQYRAPSPCEHLHYMEGMPYFSLFFDERGRWPC